MGSWSPKGLDNSISLPFGFRTLNLGFCILGALLGSTSFVKLFVVKALHEDFRTIFSFPMFTKFQATFVMLLLCYAQHLGYLFHTMFPSLSILQHYAEFNTCTIVTLQKLLGAGFFGGSVGHLVHC